MQDPTKQTPTRAAVHPRWVCLGVHHLHCVGQLRVGTRTRVESSGFGVHYSLFII